MLILRLVWPTYHNLHVLTCQLIDSPLIVGWDVVCGWFYPVSYGVAAFICYPYVCVSEHKPLSLQHSTAYTITHQVVARS